MSTMNRLSNMVEVTGTVVDNKKRIVNNSLQNNRVQCTKQHWCKVLKNLCSTE